jgi:hypothetical protein
MMRSAGMGGQPLAMKRRRESREAFNQKSRQPVSTKKRHLSFEAITAVIVETALS